MSKDIYDASFVRNLFDEMSATYGVVNLISSFGFCIRWRRQCAKAAFELPETVQRNDPNSLVVIDLMAGSAEMAWHIQRYAKQYHNAKCKIQSVDYSPKMSKLAEKKKARLPAGIELLTADALSCPLQTESADVVVSTFGLKTFSKSQLELLGREVYRMLKPGGRLAFVEISKPKPRWLSWPFLFYLERLIPIIGRMFLGNPENYRLLGVYTRAFETGETTAAIFRRAGLDVQVRDYFGGCATGVVGRKPT